MTDIARTCVWIIVTVSFLWISTAHSQNKLPQELPAEFILLVETDGVELGDVFALKSENQFFFSFKDIISVLDLPFMINTETGAVSGWFRKEENEVLIFKDPAQSGWYVLIYGNRREILDISDIALIGGDVLVSEKLLERLFALTIHIDVRELNAVISSSDPLPITQKLQRKERIASFERGNKNNTAPLLPLKTENYSAFSMPFLDFQSSANSNSQRTSANMSLLGNSDLAYMSGEYFISASDSEGLTSARLALSRESAEGDVFGNTGITRFTAGDIRGVTIQRQRNTSNDIGVRLSNAPLSRTNDFDTKDLTGFSQPGWDIELYQNGVLIDALSVQADGKYEFLEVPLYFGENNFELRFFGPQGQRKSEYEQVTVATPKHLKDDWIYDISLTKQNASLFKLNSEAEIQQDLQFGASLEKGISDNILFKTGVTTVTLDDNKRHSLIPVHIDWFMKNALLSLDYVHDLDGGQRYQANLNYTLAGHGLRMEHTYYNDFAEDIDLNNGQTSKSQFRMAGPLFKFDGLSSSYSFNMGQSKIADVSTTNTIGLSTSFYMSNLTISNTMNIAEVNAYETGDSFRFGNGILQLDKRFNGYNWRSRITYMLEPTTEVLAYSNSLLWDINDDLSTEFLHSYSPTNDSHSGSVFINWQTDYATLTANVASDSSGNLSGSLTARMSLGHDPVSDRYRFVDQRLSGTGGFAARVFQDINNNGTFDQGEPPIPNAAIMARQVRGKAITDEQGVAYMPGLPKNQVTDIELDVGSLEDPFWIAATEGVAINPRPGLVQSMDVPVVVGGEIEGTVYVKNESGEAREGSYLEVELLDENGETIDTTISGFDGFYLFTHILPGDYQIKLADADLREKKLVATRLPRVSINAETSLVLGANVYASVPSNYPEWKIVVGEYRSRIVATGVLLKIQKALIDGNYANRLALGKVKDAYQIQLKDAVDQSTAQHLCNLLDKQNIACSAFST